MSRLLFFFFNDTATTEIYTLSLHDALPISRCPRSDRRRARSTQLLRMTSVLAARVDQKTTTATMAREMATPPTRSSAAAVRSEEHTSELQSRQYLVCRLLLEKKKTNYIQL